MSLMMMMSDEHIVGHLKLESIVLKHGGSAFSVTRRATKVMVGTILVLSGLQGLITVSFMARRESQTSFLAQ